MSSRPEPTEKKLSPSSSAPLFPYIPEGITVNCLARISRSHYPKLSLVSKTFKSLLSSTVLDLTWVTPRIVSMSAYVIAILNSPKWFTLWINPNQTLPNSDQTTKIGKLLVPVTSPNVRLLDYTSTAAVVGSEIYVIGGRVDGARSSSVRILDCRSHTWHDGPNMNVARKRPASCVYDGKIYVFGGCEGLEAEVFDTKSQTWERLANPDIEIRGKFKSSIVESQGKIYLRNLGVRVAYDPEQDEWKCFENSSAFCGKFGCVIENVSYRYARFMYQWFDIKDGKWKQVKGLDSLMDKFKQVFIDVRKLVSFGGKLLLIWEGSMNDNDMKDIWCAQIMFEIRDGGEVWGNVEWVDVVQTVPGSCRLVHCLAVSL